MLHVSSNASSAHNSLAFNGAACFHQALIACNTRTLIDRLSRQPQALTSPPGTPGTSCPLLWWPGQLALQQVQTLHQQAWLQELLA